VTVSSSSSSSSSSSYRCYRFVLIRKMTKTYIVTFIAHIRQHIVKTSVTSKTTDMLIPRLLKTRNNVHRKRKKVATKRHIVRQNRRQMPCTHTQTTDSLYKTQSAISTRKNDSKTRFMRTRDDRSKQKNTTKQLQFTYSPGSLQNDTAMNSTSVYYATK